VDHVIYDSFGKIVSQSNTSVPFAFMHNGVFYDPATGLEYHSQPSTGISGRWYMPGIQRWMSEDPAGLGPDAAPYRYCQNSPTNETDPSGLKGHHWVNQASVTDNADILTQGAKDVFQAGTSGELAYDHGFDTWLNITHGDYNEAIDTLLKEYAGKVGGTIGKTAAQDFLSAIAKGDGCALGNLSKEGQAAFKKIMRWRKGFLQSQAVAAAALEANPRLSGSSIKAIARKAVNGETVELSDTAIAVYKGLRRNRGLLKLIGKRVLPGLMILSVALSAKKGYCENGIGGAAREAARDLGMADLIEDIAFPAIEAAADIAEAFIVPGGIQTAHDLFWHNRLGDLAPNEPLGSGLEYMGYVPGERWDPDGGYLVFQNENGEMEVLTDTEWDELMGDR
jgi:RHS repeat-associated protein